MLKAIQYFLIVDVVVLFVLDKGELNLRNAIITGAIIGMYFLGKVQMKLNFAIISIQGRNFNKPTKPNMPLEFGLIVVALMFYVFFLFNTELAANSVAQWFYISIVDIEKTIFFGFIFKVIGVIFTITMIFRMLNSINVIITGKSPTDNFNNRNKDNQNDDNHFDDYEEVK